MDLQEFVQKSITEVVKAVETVDTTGKRRVYLSADSERKTISFDIAVTVEESNSGSGGGDIKVLGLAKLGAEVSTEQKNATVTRVKFGVYIDPNSREENKKMNEKEERSMQRFSNSIMDQQF